MGPVAMSVATLMYVLTAISFARRKDWANCLVFSAYAVANVGLMWAAFVKKQ